MIVLFIASTLWFLGEYTQGYWAVWYFSYKYPEYQFQYVISKLVINGILCILSNYLFSLLADKLEHWYPSIKGLICLLCPLTSLPFMLVCFYFSQSFILSISMAAIGIFISESWVGPIISQFSFLLPSGSIGLAVAIFYFLGTLGGTVCNLIIGVFVNKNG